MIETVSYLVRGRVREPLLTYAWFRLWGKRVVNLASLCGLMYRAGKLRRKGARIGSLAAVGRVELNGNASRLTIGRECVLGDRVHLALHDRIQLGDYVVINDCCALLTASHDVDSPDWSQKRAPIVIEDHAWVAARAIILPGVTIGRAAVVGAGAVVTRDVPAYHVVAGNPARTVKERQPIDYRYSPARFCAPFEAWIGLRR